MSTPHRIAAPIAAVALLAAATSLPAKSVEAAERGDEPVSLTLRYSGADLGTPEGVAGLYRRIRGAAATVCARFDGAPVAQKQRRDKCVDHAVAQAVQSVHSDSLSAYHWRQIRGLKWPWVQTPTALAAR